jgi:kinesin family protein 3/17
MMAMITPSADAFAESLSTLKFATRAKKIKNEAKINEDVDQRALLRRYEIELKRLKQELQQKQNLLQPTVQ